MIIPEPIIPSAWDDSTGQNDPTVNEFLDYVNSLGQEDDEEVEDPTTMPVCNILIIYFEYIINILKVEIAGQSHLTTITAANYSKAVKVGKVIFADMLPEFPDTAEDGVAYIVDLSNKTPEEMEIQRGNVCVKHQCITKTLGKLY
jgi:hypothetical protein